MLLTKPFGLNSYILIIDAGKVNVPISAKDPINSPLRDDDWRDLCFSLAYHEGPSLVYSLRVRIEVGGHEFN